MIDSTLSFIATELDTHLNKVFDLKKEEKVILSSYTRLDGSISTENINKITISLLNIERENTLRNTSTIRSTQSTSSRVAAPLNLSLSILFGATFDKYPEALKFLSQTIAFFQSHNVFTTKSFPNLDPSIDKLVVDLQTTTIQDLNQIWGMLGGKLIPSVLYKVRLLTIDEGLPEASVPTIATVRQKSTT